MNPYHKTKYLFVVLLCLGITSVISAGGSNLYEHYESKLPSINERVLIFEGVSDEEYTGSYEQNISLHDYLDYGISGFNLGALAFPPSTVEGTSTAGWTDDGSIVRLNTASDLVGIGTTNPVEKLTVTGGNFRVEGDISLITGTTYLRGDLSVAGGDFNFGTGNATTTLTVTSVGIGFGSTTPAQELAINGDIYLTGTTTMSGGLVVHGRQTSLGGVQYSWPAADGSSGQSLETNGTGGLSWTTGSVGTATSTIFDTIGTHTWVRPAGVNSVIVTLVGGGGGGGGVENAADSAGGGGGAGGYIHGAVSVSGNVTVIVGAGGLGELGAAVGTGLTGSTTSFAADITLSAAGGVGGDSASGGTGNGGAGGAVTVGNGVFGLTGFGGQRGVNRFTAGATGGKGGDSPIGEGGFEDAVGAGDDGEGRGSGGSGASSEGGGQFRGGRGAQGFVLVEWVQ